MSLPARSLLGAAWVGGWVLALALVVGTHAQACGHHGHGGYGGYPYGYGGSGYGGYPAAQYAGGSQQGTAASASLSQNDPSVALAHQDDLNLTNDQVQRLQKMAKFGTKHAGLLLTGEQKRKLHDLLGAQPKARVSQAASTETE
jgi:hypothetical protein